MERFTHQLRLALPLLSGVFFAVLMFKVGPLVVSSIDAPRDREMLVRTLADGIDGFFVESRPVLANASSAIGAKASALAVVAALATAAAMAAVVLEVFELAVASLSRRPAPNAPAARVSAAGFWTSVVAVPLAVVSFPGLATFATAGVFTLTTIARAKLIRTRSTAR